MVGAAAHRRRAVRASHPGGVWPGWKAWAVTWTLPDPMLAAPVASPDLPPGWAGEPKWDGWRAQFSVDQGRVVLRSRRGTDMAPGFPDVVAAAGHSLGVR